MPSRRGEDYDYIYTLYGELKQGWFSAPFYFTNTGWMSNVNGYRITDYANVDSYYWGLHIYNSGTSYSAGRTWEGYGKSIRCLAR